MRKEMHDQILYCIGELKHVSAVAVEAMLDLAKVKTEADAISTMRDVSMRLSVTVDQMRDNASEESQKRFDAYRALVESLTPHEKGLLHIPGGE